MTTEETKRINRDKWPPGPWDREPDRIEWRTAHGGRPCLILRNEMGALCGYVAVEEGHPWFGKPWHAIDAEVHGGITYAASCAGHICHVPREGESDDVWWVGFDCAHWPDLMPAMRNSITWPYLADVGVYRDVRYVRDEVEGLACQAAEAGDG